MGVGVGVGACVRACVLNALQKSFTLYPNPGHQ